MRGFFFLFFFGRFCVVAKVAMIHIKGLAKFWRQDQNMKVKFQKYPSNNFWLLEQQCLEI
jgi:hypothetical protein